MKRMAAGIPGLDLVLDGGLEHGSVVVMAGPPGIGKTIMAQQVSFANATPEHKAIYYTTIAETHTKLVKHLAPFAFFDQAALSARVEFIHLGGFLQPGRTDRLQPLVSEMCAKYWTKSLPSWWSTARRCCATSPTHVSCALRSST